MSFAGLTCDEIGEMMEQHLVARISELIQTAATLELSLTEVAVQHSMERFDETKRNSERQSITNLGLGFGLKLYRKGFLPKFITRPLAKHYFLSKVR